MLIPICTTTQWGALVGRIDYNTKTNRFIDNLGMTTERQVPILDYGDCSVKTQNRCTIIGKNKEEYVVSFGNTRVYSMSSRALKTINVSNAYRDKNGKLHCIDEIEDMSAYFTEKNIKEILL